MISPPRAKCSFCVNTSNACVSADDPAKLACYKLNVAAFSPSSRYMKLANKTSAPPLLFFILVLLSPALAQDIQVAGRVRDAGSGAAIANVNIVVAGTSWGTTTDAQGKFRFSGSFSPQDTLVFSHIGYQPLRLLIAALSEKAAVLLEPKPVALQDVEIQAAKDSPMAREIPATMSTVLVEPVVSHAAIDLGDFIQRDAGVKIDETSAGQKFVSIRGSNSDEVLVIYDGIRLNSANTNTFDLAQIDLANLEKVELIKGSNTVLFGEGAFGGVINIVPRKLSDYHVSAAHRTGTYDTRELTIDLHKQIGKLAGAYTFSHRDVERRFDDSRLSLVNQSDFHTLWGSYGWQENKIEARYLRYNSSFSDPLLQTNTDDQNDVISLNYEGALWLVKGLKLSAIRKNLQEARRAAARGGSADADDRSTTLRAEKHNRWNGVHLTLGYEHRRSHFDAGATALKRLQDSFTGILKNRLDLGRPSFRYLDWDLSGRLDWFSTRRNFQTIDLPSPIAKKTGRDFYLNYKLGLNGTGRVRAWQYKIFVLHGANVKLPTLQQLFYLDAQPPSTELEPPALYVERNIGSELGINLEREWLSAPTFLRLQKLELEFATFRNSYLDKITEIIQRATLPKPFNTALAWTSGLESRFSLEMFKGLIAWDGAFLLLDISDPRVFRFKPEKKITTDLWLRSKGFSGNSHFFLEGRQTALTLELGEVSASALPARWDVDLSLEKTLSLKGVEGFCNLALRNLRNSGRSELSGFFLQDRRWYISFGARL
jgi:hypothetical protein